VAGSNCIRTAGVLGVDKAGVIILGASGAFFLELVGGGPGGGGYIPCASGCGG
jgi:hypothetical protein